MTSVQKRPPISGPYAAPLFLAVLMFCLAIGLTAQPRSSIDELEGLYRYTFKNGLMNGQKYESENRLALLKLTATSAYFNTHLEWANGHTCDLSGVADLDPNGNLIFRQPSIEGRICVFSIKPTRDGLVLGDEGGACRLISCGARGRISGVEFKFQGRGKLHADEIRKSRDFERAVEEHQHPPSGSAPHQ
jgi:hypothetical protein